MRWMTMTGDSNNLGIGGEGGLDPPRYRLAVACVAAEAATLAITWPLWQVRSAPPNLPLVELPQISFGWLLVASLVAVVFFPRAGLRLHVATLLAAIACDQFRFQPQIVGITILMIAAIEERAAGFARWYLVALWCWSGVHKLLSLDWTGRVAWNLLDSLGLDAAAWLGPFAYTVAIGEVLLGLLAMFRPRWAAPACAILHVGIAGLLLPWGLNRNFSVIPWNLCIAVVGTWLLWRTTSVWPRTLAGWAVAALLLVTPAGFYLGWVDGRLAHSLYSDNQPDGLITSADNLETIKGWGKLAVPFPASHLLLRQYFMQTAEPGAKLHIADPRPWVADAYYLKTPGGKSTKIERGHFLTSNRDEVAGVELDDPRSVFVLSRAGVRMLKRAANAMIYAAEIGPDRYRADLLDQLHGLPNLEQLQLGGCSVADDDLRRLAGCDNLRGIGLDDTDVTDHGVRYLMELPKLRYFELNNTRISAPKRQLLLDKSE